jgi:hypothetical protein
VTEANGSQIEFVLWLPKRSPELTVPRVDAKHKACGAAQRVEHYEMSGYTTARNLAQQLRHGAIVVLLSKSLAEEENADQLLNQVARSLMSVAKTPAVIEQATVERAE